MCVLGGIVVVQWKRHCSKVAWLDFSFWKENSLVNIFLSIDFVNLFCFPVTGEQRNFTDLKEIFLELVQGPANFAYCHIFLISVLLYSENLRKCFKVFNVALKRHLVKKYGWDVFYVFLDCYLKCFICFPPHASRCIGDLFLYLFKNPQFDCV